MTRFEVLRLFSDSQGRAHTHREEWTSEVEARVAANRLSRSEGEVWIQTREVRNGRFARPKVIDAPSKPVTREQLTELRQQIRGLNKKLPKGEVA